MKKFSIKRLGVSTASALPLILAAGMASAAGQYGSDSGMQSGAGQVGGQQSGMSFSELDSNGDGMLDKDEAHAAIKPEVGTEQFDQRFSSSDQNGDGSLDQSEFSAFEQWEQDTGGEQQPGISEQPETESPMGEE